VAVPGDVVDLAPTGFVVNGVVIPNTRPLAADSKGRPLTHWPFGRYKLRARCGLPHLSTAGASTAATSDRWMRGQSEIISDRW